jgi:hypothetical protein
MGFFCVTIAILFGASPFQCLCVTVALIVIIPFGMFLCRSHPFGIIVIITTPPGTIVITTTPPGIIVFLDRVSVPPSDIVLVMTLLMWMRTPPCRPPRGIMIIVVGPLATLARSRLSRLGTSLGALA